VRQVTSTSLFPVLEPYASPPFAVAAEIDKPNVKHVMPNTTKYVFMRISPSFIFHVYFMPLRLLR
jgi:hypothetical protein